MDLAQIATAPRLDEAALRREDFVPGSAVTLADGQSWQLRRPLIRFIPDDGQPVGFQTRLTLAGDDLYGDLMKRREAAVADGSVDLPGLIAAELAIGRLLLLANYDVPADRVPDLVQFGYDEATDPEGWAIREDVMNVALGHGPKASPAGDE